ncbi:MAG: hypothetical protein IT324_12260 [Anaerolineae bacterium]|nr:hypothetical protein [Anaerolineae bacterium]
MRHTHLIRLISVFILLAFGAETLFDATPVTQAQGGATPPATVQATPTATTSGNDDSEELPVYINVTGRVQAITTTTVRINDLDIVIPPGMAVPTPIKVGVVVTLRGNLRNNDTITLVVIGLGTPTPTATAVEAEDDDDTEDATPAATVAATAPTPVTTPAATVQPTNVPPVIAGCDKPNQRLATFVSTTYSVSYADVVKWRCKGYTFGVIARGYLLVVAGQEEGRVVDVATIFDLRTRGSRWSVIIVTINVHPNPDALVIIVNTGGQVVVIVDCKYYKKHKDCKKPKKPKKPKPPKPPKKK